MIWNNLLYLFGLFFLSNGKYLDVKRVKTQSSSSTFDLDDRREAAYSNFKSNNILSPIFTHYYTIEADIGLPKQHFELILSTTVSRTWVQCAEAGVVSKSKMVYYPSKSKTVKLQGNDSWIQSLFFPFETELINGTEAVDEFKFRIGGRIINLKQARFGTAYLKDELMGRIFFGGVFGLGTNSKSDFPYALARKQHQFLNKITVALNVDKSTNFISRITFSGSDPVNCEGIIGVEKSSSQHGKASNWWIDVESISLGDKIVAKTIFGYPEVASMYIGGPREFIDAVALQLNARFNDSLNAYFVDCNSKYPPLQIKTKIATYSIPSERFVFKSWKVNGQCWLQMKVREHLELGHPFVEHYCQTYDFEQSTVSFSMKRIKK